MIKVAHLTTVHNRLDVRIFQKQVKTLAANGYRVTLIACAERHSHDEGVRILALPTSRNRFDRMTRIGLLAFRAAMREHADIYHFHDPELILVGLALKLFGKTVIYDVHEDAAKDIWDKPYLRAWAKPLFAFFVGAVERFAVVFFDRVVAATPSILENLPARKTVLIRNLPRVNEMIAPTGVRFKDRSRRVVYIGGLAPFNGAEQMIRAMSELPEVTGIRLVLGGRSNSPEFERLLRTLPGSDRVDFIGWVDREAIRHLFADARAGLVLYQPTPNTVDSEPNKFFEMLSAGLPLIVSDFVHWRRFIDRYGCGLVVPPNKPAAIAQAIQSLVDDPEQAETMGRKGREIVVQQYNWEAESKKLLSMYAGLAQRPSKRCADSASLDGSIEDSSIENAR